MKSKRMYKQDNPTSIKELKRICSPYKSITDISKNHRGVYEEIRQRKIQLIVCPQAYKNRLKKGQFHSYEACKEAALNCKTYKEFAKKYNPAVLYSKNNNFYYEITRHFAIYPNKPKFKERIFYKIKKLEIENNKKSKEKINKLNKLLIKLDNAKTDRSKRIICKNIRLVLNVKLKKNYNEYWTKELAIKEALKYKHIIDFLKNNPAGYQAVKRLNISKEAFAHMTPKGHLYKREVYVIEFENKSAYIGLTKNSEERLKRHKKETKKLILLMRKYKFKLKVLTKLLENNKAQKKEEYFLNQYKKNNWKILNEMKTGSLGAGIRKWTPELVISETKKCKTISQFYKKLNQPAERFGILNECLDIVEKVRVKKPNGFYNKEYLTEFAKKFKGVGELRKADNCAYGAILRLKFYHLIDHLDGRRIKR